MFVRKAAVESTDSSNGQFDTTSKSWHTNNVQNLGHTWGKKQPQKVAVMFPLSMIYWLTGNSADFFPPLNLDLDFIGHHGEITFHSNHLHSTDNIHQETAHTQSSLCTWTV